MKEVYKTVPANLGGKVVNKTQAEHLAMQLMKAAINGKAPDRALLMKLMEQHEAREERMEEKRAKKKAEGSEDVDWDAEREAIQQRLLAVTGEYVQSLHPQLEDKS